MNDPRYLAQVGHTLGGYSAVLTSAYAWGLRVALVVAGAFVLTAAVKEFWYDKRYELPKQTNLDDVLDFGMYLLGLAAGLLVTWLAGGHRG